MEMEEESPLMRDKVKVIRKIGNGCQGEVFSVENMQSQHKYALKVIQIRKQLKERQRQRIKFQVHSNLFLSNQVLSNHFPKMYDYWLQEQSINILFELCEENAEVGFGRLKGYSERYNFLIVMLFDGLQALSILEKFNIIHRDIKPENILRNQDSFKLADLGLSRVYESGSTLTNDIGNKLGRSPQFSSGLYSTKSDIWSLGVHCFYLMENTLPFDERSLLLIRNNPNEIQKVVSSDQLEVNLQISGRRSKNVLSFLHLVLAEMIVLNPDCRLSAPQLIQSFFTEASLKPQSRIRFCLFRYLKSREAFGECYLMLLLAEVQLNRASLKMKEDAQSNKRKICIRIKETLLKLLDLTRRQLLTKFQEREIIALFDGVTQEWLNTLKQEDGRIDCSPLKNVEQALQIYKISKVRQKFPLIEWIVRLYRVLELIAAGKRYKKVLLWEIPIDLYKLI